MATDHVRHAKYGFLFGVSLLLTGIGGEAIGEAMLGSLPATVETLLHSFDLLGILIAVIAPGLFLVLFPLIE